jgi:hypothetical protein
MDTAAPAGLRAVLGLLAAVLAVLVFHQGMVGLLYASGMLPRGPYQFGPVPPFGVPVLVSQAFWAGLCGIAYGLALPRLPRGAPVALKGLGLGLLAAAVGWFVVAPIKGLPVAGGWVPMNLLRSVLINGAWGIGTALFLHAMLAWLRRRRSAGAA